jgi:hypothetical protein
MTDKRLQWEMTNIEYGFTVFEKCTEDKRVRTYFAVEDTWDEYVEDGCRWQIVENAQTIRFDLRNTRTGDTIQLKELMGLLYCTSCMEDCEVERIRQEALQHRTLVLVAFGFLPDACKHGIAPAKLEVLAEYFNERRDTSRSRVSIIPCSLIPNISLCKGEFIHDVGLLSFDKEPARQPLL